jgi:deoxyribonuclease-1
MKRYLFGTALIVAAAYAVVALDIRDARNAGYLETLPLFWGGVYPDGGETLYCARRFGPSKGDDINAEHVLPMSWAVRKLGCGSRDRCRETSPEFNRIEADLHNLFPARRDINERRRSMPYGDIRGEARRFGECDFEVDERRRVAEPRTEVRGDVARAMFYMHDTYQIPIYAKHGRLLERWHREDPPGAEERRRNDVIERIQGTRNRFIDDPGAVDALRF